METGQPSGRGVAIADTLGGASARIRCIAALLLASADSPHELGRDDLAEAAAIILDEVGEIERALTALRIRRDTPAENCGAI